MRRRREDQDRKDKAERLLRESKASVKTMDDLLDEIKTMRVQQRCKKRHGYYKLLGGKSESGYDAWKTEIFDTYHNDTKPAATQLYHRAYNSVIPDIFWQDITDKAKELRRKVEKVDEGWKTVGEPVRYDTSNFPVIERYDTIGTGGYQ